MRKISEWKDFSYRHSGNCYFTINEEGKPIEIWNTLSEMKRVYQEVKDGKATLYVAVPGENTTELFHVDDIELLGKEYGFCEGHRHIFDWKIAEYDNKKDRYVPVEINFRCGCCVGLRTLRQLSKDFKEQMGWEVKVGSCGHNTIYVNRKTIGALL